MKTVVEARLKSPSEVIELEAFGLTSGMDRTRPVILFREKGGDAVLPVWLSPLDAGIAMTQNQPQLAVHSPHEVSLGVIQLLGVKLESCHFVELRGHIQHVELRFSGSRRLKSMHVRADHAISLCLQAKARFFCTRGFIQQCRDIEAEMGQVQIGSGTKGQAGRTRPHYLN